MTKKEKLKNYNKRGLCFRCEYRARAHEKACFTGEASGPRVECSSLETTVNSCYMFKPIKPPVLKSKDESEWRPAIPGSILSGRVIIDEEKNEKELLLNVEKAGKEKFIMYWDSKKTIVGLIINKLKTYIRAYKNKKLDRRAKKVMESFNIDKRVQEYYENSDTINVYEDLNSESEYKLLERIDKKVKEMIRKERSQK